MQIKYSIFPFDQKNSRPAVLVTFGDKSDGKERIRTKAIQGERMNLYPKKPFILLLWKVKVIAIIIRQSQSFVLKEPAIPPSEIKDISDFNITFQNPKTLFIPKETAP